MSSSSSSKWQQMATVDDNRRGWATAEAPRWRSISRQGLRSYMQYALRAAAKRCCKLMFTVVGRRGCAGPQDLGVAPDELEGHAPGNLEDLVTGQAAEERQRRERLELAFRRDHPSAEDGTQLLEQEQATREHSLEPGRQDGGLPAVAMAIARQRAEHVLETHGALHAPPPSPPALLRALLHHKVAGFLPRSHGLWRGDLCRRRARVPLVARVANPWSPHVAHGGRHGSRWLTPHTPAYV